MRCLGIILCSVLVAAGVDLGSASPGATAEARSRSDGASLLHSENEIGPMARAADSWVGIWSSQPRDGINSSLYAHLNEGWRQLGFRGLLIVTMADRNVAGANRARREFASSLAIKPDCSEAFLGMAVCSRLLGELGESLMLCLAAVNSDPASSTAHERLGLAYASLGRHELAIDEMKEAIRLESTVVDGRGSTRPRQFPYRDDGLSAYQYELGDIYMSANQYDEAAEIYQRLIDLRPTD